MAIGRGIRSIFLGLPVAALLSTSPAEATDSCTRRDRALEVMAERLTVFLREAYPETIFPTGAPNPTAVARLLPALEAMFRDTLPDSQRPSIALDCRTWACHLKVLQPTGIDTDVWERAIVKHPALKGHILGSQVTARRPQADPFQGEKLQETTVYFKLADPSGGAAGTTPRMTPAWDPFFRRSSNCQRQLGLIEERTKLLEKGLARFGPPVAKFRAAPVNEALTREVTPTLQQALTASRPDLPAGLVTCRGSVCEVRVPGHTLSAQEWLALYWRRPGWGFRVTSAAPAGDRVHLTILPAGLVDGHKVLAEIVAGINKQPFFGGCHARHPARGHLLVRYVLPLSDRSVSPRPLRAEYSGSLVDTPLARCLGDEIAQALANVPVPALHGGAYQDERYDWPKVAPGP